MKKRAARYFASLIALLLMFSMLAGCGSSNQPGTSSQPSGQPTGSSQKPNKEKIPIRVWERNSGSGGPVHDFLMNFNQIQDEIEVSYEAYGENYMNILTMALNSGEAPDVFNMDLNPPVSSFAEQGHLLPLDDILTEDFKSKFHPSTFADKSNYYNNQIYCVPMTLASYKLLYNKDLFKKAGLDPDKPPKTMEEMMEYAGKITEAGKGEFYGFGMYLNYFNFWHRHIDTFTVQHGETGVYGFDYKTGKFDFGASKKYLNYWIDMYKKGYAFPGAMTIGVEPMRANFASGKIGMMIDGTWMATQYAVNIKTDIDWDAVELPYFEGAKKAKQYMTVGILYSANAASKNPEAAKKVYKAMLEGLVELRKFGDADPKTYLPANEEAAIALLPKEYTYKGLKTMLDTSNVAAFAFEPYRFITLEGDSRDILFNNILAQSADGDVDIDKAIDKAIAELNERYNTALEKARSEGRVLDEDLKPAGFDYFNRK